jgi:hypothetical protein
MKQFLNPVLPERLERGMHYAVVFLLILAWVYLPYRMAENGDFFLLYDDDFFYYLKIAVNICTRHLSSFDGTVLTNGYHPLWMAVIIGLLKIAGADYRAFFLMFALVIALCNFGTYFLAFKLSLHYTRSAALSVLLAAWVTRYSLNISVQGMEVGLTIPLILGILFFSCCRDTAFDRWRDGIFAGLLSALAVLSRLDAGLFVFIYFLGVLWTHAREKRSLVKFGLGFIIGGLPVLAYLGLNHWFFGTWLPISASAKQLKIGLMPTGTMLASLTKLEIRNLHYLFPSAAVTLAGALAAMRVPLRNKPVMVAAVLFPFLYYFTLSMTSDWPAFAWYHYPWPISFLAGALFVHAFFPARIMQKNPVHSLVLPLALLVVFVGLRGIRAVSSGPVRGHSMYTAAAKIEAFAQDHPGTYAMGDRAGIVGFRLKDRLVQLEGLVMDPKYLANIQQERDLIGVLKAYGVNYYIATNPRKDEAGYVCAEPRQGGPSVRRMTAEFKQEPVYEYDVKADDVHTKIFKIQ